MPFKLTEYHSSSFEDIIAFSAFDKNDFTNKIVFFETYWKNKKNIVYHSYTEKYIY